MIILYIIAFIFAIGIIIIIHEAGHFYCAKKAGILCHEFSIGMGPLIWQKKKGETMISIRAIPIGGYVSMADSTMEQIMISPGEKIGINLENGCVKELVLDPNLDADYVGEVKEIELLGAHGEDLEVVLELENKEVKTYPILRDAFMVVSAKQKIQITPYDRSFDSKKISRRMITISAGVVMNFVLSIVLYLIISFIQGVPNTVSTEIGSISTGYPAASFLKEGDKITSVNGTAVNTWTEFSNEMNKLSSQGVTHISLTYESDGTSYVREVDTYIALNNFGLSNIEIDSNATKYENGVQVGNLYLKYGKSSSSKSKPSDDEPLLTNGDTILSISLNGGNYQSVSSWKDVVSLIGHLEDVDYMNYKFYDHETNEVIRSKTPVYSYSDSLLSGQDIVKIKCYLGVSPTYYFSFGKCVKEGFLQFWSSATVIFSTLREMVAPTSSVREVSVSDLSGVVGIFDMVKNTLSSGFLSYLSLIALLSVNIGIMNFLPIPALDGGRFLFLVYEGITHKKPNKKFETILNNVVMLLLLALFVFVTYNDIIRLFK